MDTSKALASFWTTSSDGLYFRADQPKPPIEYKESVLSIQKSKDFIGRVKLILSKKKEKTEFGEKLDQLMKKVSSHHAIVVQLGKIKKRNGEFIVLRRLMDLIVRQVTASSSSLNQVEELFKFTLLMCVIDNPHIKTVKACYHMFQVLIKKRIASYALLQKQYSNLASKGNPADAETCKKLSASIRLAGAGSLLDDELSDNEFRLLLANKHAPEAQCAKDAKNACRKYYFIVGNMSVIPPLIEHVREFSMKVLGTNKQLSALQDLALLSCLVRSYVLEVSRLQQYIHVSPKSAQKKITSLLNQANPYVYSGYKKVKEKPTDFFELNLLENIGYFLTYYVLLVGGIFKNPQFKSPQMQTLIKGTVQKLSADGANEKVRDMLRKQVRRTMENF